LETGIFFVWLFMILNVLIHDLETGIIFIWLFIIIIILECTYYIQVYSILSLYSWMCLRKMEDNIWWFCLTTSTKYNYKFDCFIFLYFFII
jgi:hypothetical protein